MCQTSDKQRGYENRRHYLESTAKSCKATSAVGPYRPNRTTVTEKFQPDEEENALAACAKQWILGQGQDGTTYYKAVYCGREWCPRCGRNGSIPHRRRIGRWFGKFFSYKSWGYVVFTLPRQLWNITGKEEMGELSEFVKRRLKRDGYDNGFIRWHYAGDNNPRRFQPHMNVVIEAGYLSKRYIKELKQVWKNALIRTYGVDIKVVNVNYRYTYIVGKAFHLLKYVTRATYKGKDQRERLIIKGFRNCRAWGKFEKPREEATNEALKVYKSKVSIDGVITWEKPQPVAFIMVDWKHNGKPIYLGLGIWQRKPPDS